MKKDKGVLDEEFERERQWLIEKLNKEGGPTNLPQPEGDVSPEDGIDCGCCFTPAAVVSFSMIPDRFSLYVSSVGKNDSMSRRPLILQRVHVYVFVYSSR